VDGTGPRGAGSFANQLSDIMIEADEAWKLLVTAGIATSYVLLEPDPGTSRMRMTITQGQKERFIKSLEESFGNGIKDGL
jgi:hypothetical protein